MAIKIRLKKKVDSNKTQIPGKTPGKSSPSPASGNNPTLISKPFIDRISVIVNVPTAEDGHSIYNSTEFMLQKSTDLFAPNVGQGGSGGFKRSKRINLGSIVKAKHWPLLQWSADNKIVTRMRIDFVPVELGANGLLELHSALTQLMPNGWQFFARHGHITRLDVAVDVLTVRMDELHFLPLKCLTTTSWKQNGKLETINLGKPKGNYTSIYDRKAKRTAKNTWAPGKEGIRIERRLVGGKIGFVKDLYSLPNPFTALDVVQRYASPPAGEKKPYIWNLMLNAAEHMGLPAALGLLPEDKRAVYKAHLKSLVVEWWNPKSIWSNWSSVLDETKIALPKKW